MNTKPSPHGVMYRISTAANVRRLSGDLEGAYAGGNGRSGGLFTSIQGILVWADYRLLQNVIAFECVKYEISRQYTLPMRFINLHNEIVVRPAFVDNKRTYDFPALAA